MQQLIKLGFLVMVLTMASLAAGCEPSIDVQDLKSFESSLAAAKGSMSPADITNLENAIFELAMDDTVLNTPGRWVDDSQHGWYVGPRPSSHDDYTGFSARMIYDLDNSQKNHLEVNKREFLDNFNHNMASGVPHGTVYGIASIVQHASHVDDPVREAEERLVNAKKQELQKIIDKEGEIVAVTVDCRQPAIDIVTITYSIKNDSKWPITGVTLYYKYSARSGYHEITAPVPPGATSNDTNSYRSVTGGPLVNPCQDFNDFSVVRVSAVGRDDFAPITRDEWLKAKDNLESLLQARADISRSLQELMYWLRSIH